MINAELSYNPYLLQTVVRFNGQVPKINCQIEKYEKMPLKDWVDQVPIIFYNEMNGYDFDLLFTGTKPDFSELQRAFHEKGVSEREVRLIHKSLIGDADTMSEQMDEFVQWLKSNPNRQFDCSDFFIRHSDLFDGSYPYIIVRGDAPKGLNPIIGVETIESIQEIETTNLTSTPILFHITQPTYSLFRRELRAILRRHDIRQDQLFFNIHSSMNEDQVIRVIYDTGITAPQIVNRADDIRIIEFLRNYPITEYVRDAIIVLRNEYDKMAINIQEENKKSITTNATLSDEIKDIDSRISALKGADSYFANPGAFIVPKSFAESRAILIQQLSKWKERKTKIVGDTEIKVAANDYVLVIEKSMKSFVSTVSEAIQKTVRDTESELKAKYVVAEIDIGFTPDGVSFRPIPKYSLPNIQGDLLALEEEEYVEPKADIFGALLRPSQGKKGDPVRVVTCHLEQWRQKAIDIVSPIADRIIHDCSDTLRFYHDDLIRAYHIHLNALISTNNETRNKASSRLSLKEQALQNDNAWLEQFNEHLTHIERGNLHE